MCLNSQDRFVRCSIGQNHTTFACTWLNPCVQIFTRFSLYYPIDQESLIQQPIYIFDKFANTKKKISFEEFSPFDGYPLLSGRLWNIKLEMSEKWRVKKGKSLIGSIKYWIRWRKSKIEDTILFLLHEVGGKRRNSQLWSSTLGGTHPHQKPI